MFGSSCNCVSSKSHRYGLSALYIMTKLSRFLAAMSLVGFSSLSTSMLMQKWWSIGAPHSSIPDCLGPCNVAPALYHKLGFRASIAFSAQVWMGTVIARSSLWSETMTGFYSSPRPCKPQLCLGKFQEKSRTLRKAQR